MNGGGCCRPTLPPRKYWSLCTRGADNNCRVVAWYNGWDSGVAQALRDGMGGSPVLTGPDIYHTNSPYPVELPDDLRKTEVYEEDLQLAPETLGVPTEGVPAPAGAGDSVPTPQAEADPQQYNPPAKPVPMTEAKPVGRERIRTAFDSSLTPPAPPRDQ